MQLITQLNSHFRKLANDELQIQDKDKAQASKRSKKNYLGSTGHPIKILRLTESMMANKPQVEKAFSDVTEREIRYTVFGGERIFLDTCALLVFAVNACARGGIIG